MSYMQSFFHRLQHIRQGDWLVKVYAEKFHQLVPHNDLNKHEDQLMLSFMDGLRPAILYQIGLGPTNTYPFLELTFSKDNNLSMRKIIKIEQFLGMKIIPKK